MSFRELKDELFLMLLVKGGHGFGFATYPLIITANLAGNMHESFVTEPGPQPKFENEFVWIMDKTKMKSLWTDKIPIRLECHSINQSIRNRIGYVILNLRDAQIIQDESKIVEKQTRLLGLSKDISLLKPELNLSFYITDVPLQKPELVAEVVSDGSPKGGPVRLTLGAGRDHFLLTIAIDNVSNFRQLLPSQCEDVEVSLLSFCYRLLGTSVSSAVGGSRLQVSVATSWPCLQTYLKRADVSLALGTLHLGHASIELQDLLRSEGVPWKRGHQFLKCLRCRSVVVPAQPPLASASDDLPADVLPAVDFTVTLSSEPPIARHRQNNTASSSTSMPPVGAGGDADRLLPLQVPETPPLVAGGETYRVMSPPSSASVLLNIIDIRIHYSSSFHINPDCWLRVEQAGGEGRETAECQAACLPQNFHLTISPVQPVTLILGQGEQLIASATLHPPNRFSEIHQFLEENKVTAQLHHPGRAGEGKAELVGEVDVAWILAELPPAAVQSHTGSTVEAAEPHTAPTQSCTQTHIGVDDALSPRSRELKITSFVQELEDWAEKQRIMVMEGLKEEEASRLERLQRVWEEEAGGQLAEGRQLVSLLQEMRNQLAAKHTQLTESEAKMRIYKEELDRVHESKLQEFKDLSRRMQEEFNHKLALIASDKSLLEKEVERLRSENMEIKEASKEIEKKGATDQRLIDSLNHELSVLKEKLSQEQESKQFFKAHCRKAEQEIHRLNTVRQRELEARLSSERNNMEQLVFQQLMVERSDLKQDQQLLQEIRHKLRPQIESPSSTNSITDNCNAVSKDDRHIRRAT